MSMLHCQQKLSTNGLEFENVFKMRRRAVTSPKRKVRVIVMGSPSVGKTSIINQYMKQKIIEEYTSTLSEIGDEEQNEIRLEILDTDGPLLPSMRKLAIRTAHAFVLVYAVDDEESFDYISDLRNEIIKMRGETVPMVVVGNKVDRETRQVHPILADCLVSIDWECDHFEVCATDGFEVSGVFNQLLHHPDLERQLEAASHGPDQRKHSLPACSSAILYSHVESPTQKRQPFLNMLKRMFSS